MQAERLNREGDDVRLRDRLSFADRERRVLVGELGEIVGDEVFTRDAPKCVQDLCVGDSPAREVCVDHAYARTSGIRHGILRC